MYNSNITCFSGSKGAVENCQTCHGSGMYVRLNRIGPGMVQQIQTVCRDCSGQGERILGNKLGIIYYYYFYIF